MRATIAAGLLCGLALWTAPTRAEEAPRLDGHWEGVTVLHPGEFEVEVTVDLKAAADGSLSGHLAYPDQSAQEYALDTVKLDGDSFLMTATDEQGTVSIYRGRTIDGGKAIKGDLTEGGRQAPFELHRVDAAAAARQPPAVRALGPDGAQLKALFNQEPEKVRVVMVLSPGCGTCRMSASMVERHLLEAIPDPALSVYLVWEKIGGEDTEEAAARAGARLTDPRLHQLWSPEHFTSKAFHTAVGAKKTLAWDIFLAFGKGKMWTDAPPAPDAFMHNQKMNDELPKDHLLNAETLAREVKALLLAPASAAPAKASEQRPPA